ncbi:MAG: FtsX-like permease family protein [Bacillota bacterium]
MKNNNAAAIRRLIKSSLRANKKRNFFITTAIALTTLLIASVFSIGMSIMESMSMQQIRLMGTTAHASVTHITQEQIERLKQLDYVHTVGTGNNIALVKNTPSMGDMALSLHYFDAVEWEKLRVPSYTDVTGSYPQKEDEIMVPLWVLERLGINNPVIGMEIPLAYYPDSGNGGEPVSQVFRLSGWFTSYVHIRSGNMDIILVSKALSQKHGKTVENDGSATVLFVDSSRVLEYCGRLERDLELSETQKVKPVPIYDASDEKAAHKSLIALAIVTAFLIFTGFLLIYNVLYISVSRDVRFYGLLKTIGTTPGQIRSIVLGQILRFCLAGIPLGAAAALLLSFVAVPALLSKSGNIVTGAVVSFSPFIYIGAALLALLTAILGAFRPALKAASISPVEAQKFTGIPFNKRRAYSSARGKPCRMALRNISRNGKRAVIVLLSLFLGITTFFVVTTLVTSMDTDNYVNSYIESDFVLQNNTVKGGYEPKQKFDAAFIDAIRSLPGFESMRVTTREWMRLEYSPEKFGKYLDDFIKNNNAGIDENYVRGNFTGIIAGIDREAISKLNEVTDNPVDIGAFERGEVALIASNKPDLFENVDEITIIPMENAGESGIWDKPDGEPVKVPVGGFVPYFFERIDSSIAPTVFVSNTLMKKIYGEPAVLKLQIEVAEGYEEQALDTIKQLSAGDYEISRVSKPETREELREAKIMLYILGGGIALILALIGILNFVNIMSVDIVVRKQELAMLECVGMSRGQARRMLVSEGLIYSAITLFLVFTAGNAVTFGIFKLFQQQATYAIFTYPFIPVLAVSLALLAICVITPELVYRSICSSTVVERLREAE